MGMFDEIKCEYPLPDEEMQNETFQTKDFHNAMDHYTITKEGRLIWHKTRYEEVPEKERKYHGTPKWEENPIYQLMGSMRSIPVANIDVQHHGVIRFYTSKVDGWFEYEAKFTDGQVIDIKRIKELGWRN